MRNDIPMPADQDMNEAIKDISRCYEYTVRSAETDSRDELQLFALMSMIQEAASVDAQNCGLGAAQLDPLGYSWLLLRTSVRLFKIPKWQDRIAINTWTNGVERLFSIREFSIQNHAGCPMARATTSWLVVDQKSHRPQKITVLEDNRVLEQSFSALGFCAPKIEEALLSLPAEPVLSRYAGYSEIDRNNHVNNTRYVAWCLDAIGMDSIPSGKLLGIDINYVSEIRLGETVDLFTSPVPVESAFCHQARDVRIVLGRHAADGRTAFTAFLYWDGLL